jgi:hypothetical protein
MQTSKSVQACVIKKIKLNKTLIATRSLSDQMSFMLTVKIVRFNQRVGLYFSRASGLPNFLIALRLPPSKLFSSIVDNIVATYG